MSFDRIDTNPTEIPRHSLAVTSIQCGISLFNMQVCTLYFMLELLHVLRSALLFSSRTIQIVFPADWLHYVNFAGTTAVSSSPPNPSIQLAPNATLYFSSHFSHKGVQFSFPLLSDSVLD